MVPLLLGHASFAGPHAGPGHVAPSFFCAPVLFWSLLIGCVVALSFSRRATDPAPAPPAAAPAAGSHDGPTWPDLDPASPPGRREDREDADSTARSAHGEQRIDDERPAS